MKINPKSFAYHFVTVAERLHQLHCSTVHARHHSLVEGHHDAARGVIDIVVGQGENGPGANMSLYYYIYHVTHVTHPYHCIWYYHCIIIVYHRYTSKSYP